MGHVARVRDFFVDYSVRALPAQGRWLVEFVRADGSVEWARTYVSMHGALEAIEEQLSLMSDESAVREQMGETSRSELHAFVQETSTRQASGELSGDPTTVMDIIQRDELREWLERQMEACD